MSTYRIQRGDTLATVARRFGTSVSDLMRANPQIQNANLIHVGNTLHLPGRRDDFQPSPTRRANDPRLGQPTSVQTRSAGGSRGQAAFDIARQYQGRNISDLKYNGSLARYLDKWPGNNVCCANFVSACYEKAGLLTRSQHHNSVRGLAANLRKDPDFREFRDLRQAKPGDIVCLRVHGRSYAHVVMFAGFKNGQPQFIGSNNANRDGTQRITLTPMSYSVDAVFSHR